MFKWVLGIIVAIILLPTLIGIVGMTLHVLSYLVVLALVGGVTYGAVALGKPVYKFVKAGQANKQLYK